MAMATFESSSTDMWDTPPGTEIMRSTIHHRVVEAQTSHQVLIPVPSNDLEDPLNWSWKWKTVSIVNQVLCVFFPIIPALSIAPVTPVFVKEFHTSESNVSLFTGVCVLTLGFANFIIVPFSNTFGRRAACLCSVIVIICANIWQALAKDTGSFFGARALIGIGGAVSESVMVQVIADIFFLHERGLWMGVYFASYFVGTFIGPIIAGNLAQYVGWRSFFWLCTGLSAINLVSLACSFPETKYHRAGIEGLASAHNTSIAPEEPKAIDEETSHNEAQAHHGIVIAALGRGKPGRGQWKLAQKHAPGVTSSLANDFVTPVWILTFPIIAWSVMVVSAAASTILVMNLTQSAVFSSPPYNFSPGAVGFVNFAFVIGGLLSMGTAGPLSDWIAKRLTIRNADVREPEMRILAMIPYFAIMVLGCIVIGLGYQHGWPWEVVVVLGYSCIGIQVVALPAIAVAYAVDCYKPISGEILVICTVVKNAFGFGMSWWVEDLTPMKSVMVLLGCNAGACLCGIPIYFFGKQLRRITAKSEVHKMEAIM